MWWVLHNKIKKYYKLNAISILINCIVFYFQIKDAVLLTLSLSRDI